MMTGGRSARVVGLLLVAATLLTGCATATNQKIEKFTRGTSGLKVLLMPLDIELYELNAGGALEPKADWTKSAKTNVRAAIRRTLQSRNAELVEYVPSADGTPMAHDEIQLVKLHAAVGGTVLANSLGHVLPTKEGKFDWTLGHDVQKLRQKGTDYALFVFIRDSYVSTGRVVAIAIGALFGVGLPGGRQIGFASLVDLNTGDIVWFNRLLRGSGDLRTAEAANDSVELLLNDLPK